MVIDETVEWNGIQETIDWKIVTFDFTHLIRSEELEDALEVNCSEYG